MYKRYRELPYLLPIFDKLEEKEKTDESFVLYNPASVKLKYEKDIDVIDYYLSKSYFLNTGKILDEILIKVRAYEKAIIRINLYIKKNSSNLITKNMVIVYQIEPHFNSTENIQFVNKITSFLVNELKAIIDTKDAFIPTTIKFDGVMEYDDFIKKLKKGKN